jgi:hypothetical protein
MIWARRPSITKEKSQENPEEEEAPQEKESSGTTAGELLQAAVKAALPVVVSALVSVGFVAFAGKAVLWARFDALQVPADQVVKAVPQSEAVATGASMLLIFGLFGLLSALAVFLIDRAGRATPGMGRGLLAIVAVEAVAAVWFASGATIARILATEVVLVAIGAIFWSTFVYGLTTRDREVSDFEEGKDEEQQEVAPGPFYQRDPNDEGHFIRGFSTGDVIQTARFALGTGTAAYLLVRLFGGGEELAWVIALALLAAVLLAAVARHCRRYYRRPDVKSEREERRHTEERRRAGEADPARRKPRGFALEPSGAIFVVACIALAVAIPSLVLHEWWLAVALGTVAVLGVGLWRIAYFEGRFVWYGLATFISVPLFGTVMLMVRNIDEPQVQPLAMIRTTDGPDEAIEGLYVTEASDRIYFATVATEGCEKKVTPDSGRLLWVPKSEVVAMSLGPLQGVEEAGETALEMSRDLTPGPDTGTAPIAQVEEGGAEAHDTRLEDVGPAVRPNFGTGLRVEPETVSPGAEATLWLSSENPNVEGFGPARAARNLRLGGKLVDIAKEGSGTAERAEYIELKNHRLIALAKDEPYVYEDNEYVLAREADEPTDEPYVRLEDPAVLSVEDEGDAKPDAKPPFYVRVVEDPKGAKGRKGVKVASATSVSLAGGRLEGHLWESERAVPLKGARLLRQAWHTDHIRFHVPDDARSGAVTVECSQLAGAPLLRVSHKPTARLDVRVGASSPRVSFDSTRSSDEDKGEKLKRRWKVDGVREGHGKKLPSWMPPEPTLHTIELTVVDRDGNSDTARLLLLRLPTRGDDVVAGATAKQAVAEARKAIEKAVAAERPKQIELDGYTDARGPAEGNLATALDEAAKVRRKLLPEPSEYPTGERAIPVAELSHGERCRIGSGAVSRHVDVFVLNEDVIVKLAKGCRARKLRLAHWHPPSTSTPLASISSTDP